MKNALHPIRFALPLMALSGALLSPVPASAQCPNPVAADFRQQTLIPGSALNQPVEMAVARDGRAFVAERSGKILVYNPASNQHSTAATLDVYLSSGEPDVGGVLGLAVSPSFASDNWLYVYYGPRSLWNGIANNTAGRITYRLSRFQVTAGNTLNLSSEQVLLTVPSIWETHNSGSLKFGKNSDLYLSTGDNHNPFCSEQYSPMDERPGNSWCDDQGTTANSNNLNGKVIRIHPEPNLVNGKYYTVPAGNLFAPATAKTVPEIYTMGHRNPFRIFPDSVTGRLYIAEFGPAAGAASARGPAGADQIKATDAAAFLGYPYFLKDNQAYCHWNYATGACGSIQGQASQYFDPASPRNYSPNNDGINILPPARPAILWEHDGPSADPVSGLEGCGFGVGPVYHFDPALLSTVKFPPFFNDKLLIFNITQGNWQPKLVNVAGAIAPINSSRVSNTPWNGIINVTSGLIDAEYGPGDGALYLLDYGSGYYTNNGDAALKRISYMGCLPNPVLKNPRISLLSRAGFLPVSAGQIVNAPLGAVEVGVYDLAGGKIWGRDLEGVDGSLRLPQSLGSGLLWIRFR
jgi:cytochrome c